MHAGDRVWRGFGFGFVLVFCLSSSRMHREDDDVTVEALVLFRAHSLSLTRPPRARDCANLSQYVDFLQVSNGHILLNAPLVPVPGWDNYLKCRRM